MTDTLTTPAPTAAAETKPAKPPITYVLMVVDSSGSMESLAEDVIGGFNTYLGELQADQAHRYRVSVTLFDTRLVHYAVAEKPKKVHRFTADRYKPSGGTALLDAIGSCITAFEEQVPELGDGERVLLVVQTDGGENSSTRYVRTDIRGMIADREKTGRWTCVYLGAGPDAWGNGQGLGFAAANTVDTAHTGDGTRSSYTGLTRATVAYAAGADPVETVSGLRSAITDPTAP